MACAAAPAFFSGAGAGDDAREATALSVILLGGSCASLKSIGGVIHVKASFSDEGFMSVSVNGEENGNYSPFPSSAAQGQVVEVM